MRKITDILGTNYPLIQAPMSWITDANLVAAVSNAGGLGVLGPNAGQTTKTENPQVTGQRMYDEIMKTKMLTENPFGVNLILGNGDVLDTDVFLKEVFQASLSAGIRIFVSVGEPNEQVFNTIKKNDGIIVHRPLTPTVKNMKKSEELGADIIVATGYDEGGVIPARGYGTFTIVPTMVDLLDVPVMAAGGINDARGVQAAFALGAQGVYIGTRFIATKESPAAKQTKEKIIASGYDDLVLVSNQQRSIDTRVAEKISQIYHDPNNEINTDVEVNKLGGLKPAMLDGNIDQGIISVNTGIDIITNVPTVSELVQQLFEK